MSICLIWMVSNFLSMLDLRWTYFAVMSVDGETSRVMRGVQHGACDYLLKPIRMKELRNIWQHVIRKRIHETGYIDGLEVIPMTRSTSDKYDWEFLGGKEHLVSLKKRKDINEHDNKDSADSSCMKKSRVDWSVNLHQKFVDAVNQIGFDKVGPKKILDIMKVPGLTRENVASHLQKYRLYLTRLHKEDDLQTACSGNKHSDSSLKDADQNVSPHDTVYLYQDNAAEEKYSFSGNLLLQNVHPRSNGNHLQGTVPEPASSVTTTRGIPVSKNKRNSQLEFNHTIASPESEEAFEALNPKIQEKHYLWSRAPEFQIEQEHKPLAYLESGFSDLQACQLQSILSFSSGPSVQENDAFCSAKNLLNTCNLNQTRSWMDSLQIQPIANNNTFEFMAAMMSIKDPNCTAQLGCRLPFAFMDDDFHISCFEADSSIENIGRENIDLPSYSDPEISNNLYDALRSAWEHSNDPGEYRAVDQGLFIA